MGNMSIRTLVNYMRAPAQELAKFLCKHLQQIISLPYFL